MNIIKILVLSFVVASPVWASSDNYCLFSLSISNINNSDVYRSCSNLPFVTPINDTRINLLLLVDNRQIQKETLKQLSYSQPDANYYFNYKINKKDFSEIPFGISTNSNAYHQQRAQANRLQASFNQATKQLLNSTISTYNKNNPSNKSEEWCKQCVNSSKMGMLNFLQQLAITKGITPKEQEDLAMGRYILYREDANAIIGAYVPYTPSDAAKPLTNYLKATEAFYNRQFDQAINLYNQASNTEHSWVKETSIYMIARILLNQGQEAGYDKWGFLELDKVNQIAITKSRAAFDTYLKNYPRGRYTASAKGLLRRIYWLQNNQPALINVYENLLENPENYYNTGSTNRNSIADLFFEIDDKILLDLKTTVSAFKQTPKILAIFDLMNMRTGSKKRLTLAQLKAQKPSFLNNTELYNFVLASYFTYVEPIPEQVLELIASINDKLIEENSNIEITSTDELINETLSYFELSEQVLRAIALEAQQKWDEAERLWIQLYSLAEYGYQKAFIELGLALNYEKSGKIEKAFSANSLITTPQLKYVLLRKNASRNQLKQLIAHSALEKNDKANIIYLILYKDLLSKNYKDFLNDRQLLVTNGELEDIKLDQVSYKNEKATLNLFSEPIPTHAEYHCPTPVAVATLLKTTPNNANALNCLSEFSSAYTTPYNSYLQYLVDNLPGVLGTNKPTDFGKTPYSTLASYQQVIADKNAPADDQAYALYKAIRCFASSGYNRCDNQNISLNERRGWFRTLHSTHVKTIWARMQKIYW